MESAKKNSASAVPKRKGPRLVSGEGPDNAPAPNYQPTPAEQRILDQQAAKRLARGPLTHMAEDPKTSIIGIVDHADPEVGGDLYMAALGTTDWDFGKLITAHLASLSTDMSGSARVDNASFKSHQAMVQGIGPIDEIESLLAVQMAAIHSATMMMAGRLRAEKRIDVSESYERSLNRLARTFTAQVEALKRHRTRGVQKVIVQHVQVNEGGQAVVAGEMNRGGAKNEGQPHGRDDSANADDLRFPEGETVLGTLEAIGLPVPGTGSEGLERVPISWGAGRAETGKAK